jgi:GNAT superfamily N-acetyltransferase
MARHNSLIFPARHAGFVAWSGGVPVGAATYTVDGGDCELTFIDSGRQHGGIGTLLLQAVEDAARRARCTRLWLVTTNDNLTALSLYQRRGFRLRALHPGAVVEASQLKPKIPEAGDFGIPLRDEIDLDKDL